MLLLAFAFLTPQLLTAPPVKAVDIFSNCVKTSSANQCSDCKSQAANTVVCKDVVDQQGSNTDPIITIIKAAITIISYVVGVAAVIGIILNGIRYIISNGDTNAISGARTGLAYSLVGIAVTVLAQLIVVFVLDRIK